MGVGALLLLQLSLAVFAYVFYALTAPPAVNTPGDAGRRSSGTRPDSTDSSASPSSSSSSSSESRDGGSDASNRGSSGTPSGRSDPPQYLDHCETQGLVQTTSEGLEVGGVGEFKEYASVADDTGGNEN